MVFALIYAVVGRLLSLIAMNRIGCPQIGSHRHD
jgi:hypothetical protein